MEYYFLPTEFLLSCRREPEAFMLSISDLLVASLWFILGPLCLYTAVICQISLGAENRAGGRDEQVICRSAHTQNSGTEYF